MCCGRLGVGVWRGERIPGRGPTAALAVGGHDVEEPMAEVMDKRPRGRR